MLKLLRKYYIFAIYHKELKDMEDHEKERELEMKRMADNDAANDDNVDAGESVDAMDVGHSVLQLTLIFLQNEYKHLRLFWVSMLLRTIWIKYLLQILTYYSIGSLPCPMQRLRLCLS